MTLSGGVCLVGLRTGTTREEWDRQIEAMKKPWEDLLVRKWQAGG